MEEKYNENIIKSTFYPLKELDKICGIYKIRNIINNKFYIGSALDMKDRKKGHFSRLRSKTYKHHCYKLQKEFTKFGEKNFIFEVVQFCEPDERLDIEQKLLDEHWGKPYCYNASPYAIGSISSGKEVICLTDGKIFRTIRECCRYYNLEESGVSRNIQGMYIEPERRFTTTKIYNKMLEDGYKHNYILENYNSLIINYSKYFEYNNPKPPVKCGKDNNRAVSIICLTDNIAFDTIKECCEYYNRDRSGIVKNINGKYENPPLKFTYKSIYDAMIKDGYTHDYIFNNYNSLLENYRHMLYKGKKPKGKFGGKNVKATAIICLDDNKIFDTITECVDYYKRDRTSIVKNCNGEYVNPEKKFMYKDTYDTAIKNGYNLEYIYTNHQSIIRMFLKRKEVKKVNLDVKSGGENPNAKKIKCVNDDNIFNSIKECIEYYNISAYTFYKTFKNKDKFNLNFEYINNIDI